MRKLFLSAITMLIMTLCVAETQAQDKKAERKAKQEARQIKLNDTFVKIVETKNFRFNVSTIDADFAPQLAYMQLRGGYLVSIRGEEVTVKLPLSGPNNRQGNAPTAISELSFTALKHTMQITPNGEGGMEATILVADPRTNYSYTLVISNATERETLTVYATGIDRIRYFGGLTALK